MSFLNYLDNKQDFLTTTDLLDLIDLNLLPKEIDDTLDSFKNDIKYLELSKIPIYILNNDQKNILDDSIFYKKIYYSTSEDYLLIDRISKSIIVYNTYDFSILDYKLFKHDRHLIDFKKKKLEEYNIYLYKDILKKFKDFLRNKQDELIYKNYPLLYEHGKSQFEDIDKIDSNIANELKISYIFDEDIEEESFDYIYDNDSMFYHIQGKYEFLLINYLRDENYISELIETEFNKSLNSIDYYKYTNQKFYRFERTKRLKQELIKSFENDKKLNIYKAMYKAHSLAGKTININGIKYENNISKPYYNEDVDNIEIGRYSDRVKFKDIKKMTFGKKVLFDITNY